MWMQILNFIADHIVALGLGCVGLFVLKDVIHKEKKHHQAKETLKKAVKLQLHEPLTLHPQIDPNLCAGCASCTKVCPEGDILQMIDHKAVLVSPSKCVGHGECERACPTSAIQLVFGTKTRGMDIPRVTKNYESNIAGLYIAGELGGMGLIRNAIKQGAQAAEHALSHIASITPSGSTADYDYDLLIVGAGPAGLSAGLVAIQAQAKYLCIEQNSFGGSVYNFPRQKIVMTHPFELPMIGKKSFTDNVVSKEQLLEYWSRVRQTTGLQVQEKTEFKTLVQKDNIFYVETSRGRITAKKVILAMGVRGSPRRLGVPGEELSKVTYNLIDPEQYQNKNIVVVGGGNAGVEAAQMLGQPKWKNNVRLLVRSAQFDRCNEQNINIITAMSQRGEVEICFETQIEQILQNSVKVKQREDSKDWPNDFVLIFAGAEMPSKFLMSLGVAIDKKFAQGLGTISASSTAPTSAKIAR